jgi:hypothetical protein
MKKTIALTTTLRLTPQDREILARLGELTGISSLAGLFRLAIRNLLIERERDARPSTKKR